MCIQWCCKHCPPTSSTTLTHKWALSRCNEFYIARSNGTTTLACPKGPWEFRRAFHRHPYRGAQRCDACKKAGKNRSKLAQSIRQRANAAIGELPEYTGALFVGELEIPKEFYRNTSQRELQAGEVDAMKVDWEGFSLANGQLSSHDLEREWAKRLAALGDLGRDGGGWMTPSYSLNMASTFSRGEDHEVVRTAPKGEISRNRHQQMHRQHDSTSPTCEQKENSDSTHHHVQNNGNPSKEHTLSTTVEQEIISSGHPHVQNNNNRAHTDTEKSTTPPVGNPSRQEIHPHHQPCNDNISRIGKVHRTNLKEYLPAALRAAHQHHCDASLPTRSAPASQARRTRPWDL